MPIQCVQDASPGADPSMDRITGANPQPHVNGRIHHLRPVDTRVPLLTVSATDTGVVVTCRNRRFGTEISETVHEPNWFMRLLGDTLERRVIRARVRLLVRERRETERRERLRRAADSWQGHSG